MKILKNKKLITSLVVLFFLVVPIGLLAEPEGGSISSSLSSGVGAAVSVVVGVVALLITSVLGLISTLLINIIVSVAQFNDIINVEVVRVGWVIIRDLCNMFFVLIFLVIAFATILRVESYNFKKMLPKLLMYAVLINFSRTIFGLIIDASTIVMLTFVNGFANAPGNFVGLMKMQDVLAVTWDATSTKDGFGTWGVAIGIIAGVLASVMTVVVLAVILAVLAMRIVMLWIYTVLSPLAFLGFGFDPLKKFTQEIWEDFIKTVIIGPVLAFFIYLAFKVEASVDTITMGQNMLNQGGQVCAGINKLFCGANFQKYIIVIAMLMGGLKVSQKIGGEVSKIAGKTENWTKGKIKAAGNKSSGYAWTGAKYIGSGVKSADKAFGGVGSRFVNNVLPGSKNTVGRAAKFGYEQGGVLGGIVGTVSGMAAAPFAGGLGLAYKNTIGKKLDNMKKRTNAQMKIAKDDSGAKFFNEGEKDYKEHDGGFYEWDKKNKEFVGGTPQAPGSGASALEVGGKTLKDASDRFKIFVDSMDIERGVGRNTRDAAEQKKIEDLAKKYSSFDIATLERMLPVTGNKSEKNAMTFALAKKGSANNQKHVDFVNDAKEAFSGNSLLSDAFMESMKGNASLYFADRNGTIQEQAMTKAINKGKIKLDDQSIKGLSLGAMQVFAKAAPDYGKFQKSLDNAIKSKEDSGNLKSLIGKNIGSMGYDNEDANIRKAYANVSGDYRMAHAHSEAGGVHTYKLDGLNLLGSNMATMKADDFANMDSESLNDATVQATMAKTINIETLRKIAKSNKMQQENIKTIISAMKDRNGALASEILTDPKLAKYL